MRKLMLTAGLAGLAMSALMAVPAQATEWIAAAANGYGSGYASDWSENGAKAAAINNCESNTGRTCAWTRRTATSVPSNWYLVVVRCDGGRYGVGASQWSPRQAQQTATNKAGGYNCYIDQSY